MQRVLMLLKNLSVQSKTKIVFAAIILLLIWLVLPFIPINSAYPFKPISIRFILTGLLLLGVGAWYGIGFFQIHKAETYHVIQQRITQVWQLIKQTCKTLWLYSKEYSSDLHDKIKRNQKKRRLKRLPWYLVLGSPQSGKQSLIKQSGLYFQRPEHIGDEALSYINQFPDYDWWFSQQGILIDTQTSDKNADLTSWKRFVKLLKRERRNKPLNGIVLTISLTEVVLLSHKQRQDLIQNISNYIRDIHHVFKSYVPVYLVFNKTDRVEGFMEFFENLSKEELAQVWGMTFPII